MSGELLAIELKSSFVYFLRGVLSSFSKREDSLLSTMSLRCLMNSISFYISVRDYLSMEIDSETIFKSLIIPYFSLRYLISFL